AIQLADDFLRAVFLEMFGDPVTNPKGWEVRKLGECLQFMTSGSRGWAKYYSEKGSKFIRIMNVGKNKLLLDDIAYVEPPATKEADRTRVEIGDVLLSITADLGRSAVVTKELNGAYINQHLALLRPLSKKINSKYLAAFLSSDMALIQFQAANKSAVKSGLNFTDIREFKVLLPPIELQNRFEDLLIYSEETLEKKKSSINGVDMLFNSLSQKAFSGQL
ncbi:MAG: restriction endonuclease subunit S, partial [Paraglaciecola sp.]|nr:restriction endonuclease subunit S [Paraglaciecola sp.]